MIASIESLEFAGRLTNDHVEQLWRILQSEAWGRGRTLKDVRRAIEHSDLIFPLCDRESGRLVAFARVLTDFVYKATVLDVVVEQHHRDLRFGKVLLDAITAHPALLFVEHIEVACHEKMAPFYEKCGFQARVHTTRVMCKVQEPLFGKTSVVPKAS